MIYCRDMLKASDKKYFPFIIKPEKAAAHFTAGILRKDDDGNIKLFYFNPLGYSTPAELKNAEKRLMLDNIASLDSMQLICSPHKIQNVRLDGGGLVSCGPISVMFIEYALKNPAWIDSLTDEFTLPPNLSQFIDDDQETYQTRLVIERKKHFSLLGTVPNERLGDIFNESDIFNDQLSVALKAMQSAQYPFENDETIFNIKFGTEDDSWLGSSTAVDEELDDMYDAGSSQESSSAPISPSERDTSQQDGTASGDEIDLTDQTTEAMYPAELDIAAQCQAELDIATQRQADLDAATQRKVELDAATQRQADLDAAIQHEDELDAKEEDQTEQGTEYINTLKKLVALKNQAHPVALDEPLDKLIEHVKKLKQEKKTPIADLTDALSCTYLRLTNQLDPAPYHDIALKMQGKTSIGLKILGGLMLTLGITAAILGIIFFPALVGVSAAVTLSGVGATTMAATGVATTSVLFGLGGAALFAKSRQKSLSAAMSKLNHTLEEESFTFDTPTPSV